MVVVQNYQSGPAVVEDVSRFELDGYADDVDLDEIEGGDGESAQAVGGALGVDVPDPYLLPVGPVPSLDWGRPAGLPSVREQWREANPPSAFPIASSRRAVGGAVNPHTVTETSPAKQVHAGAASTFLRVDGDAGGPMIARGEDEVSRVLSGWPFTTDDRPRDGEHVR